MDALLPEHVLPDLFAITVCSLIEGHRYHFSDEADLQAAIGQVLDGKTILYRREHRLSDRDHIDFLVDPGLGVEVKVSGSLSSVVRQMMRYAEHPEIKGLVLVTTQMQHRLPRTLAGKPVRTALIPTALR